MKEKVGKHVQKPDTEDQSESPFLLSLRLQIPDAVHRQNEDIDITQKGPNTACVWRYALGTAITRYHRIPSLFNGCAEEDGIEDESNIEDGIGSYCTVYEPFDFGIVIDGEDSAEEEEEGRFDAERDGKIQDLGYVAILCKNVESGTTDSRSDRMKAHL